MPRDINKLKSEGGFQAEGGNSPNDISMGVSTGDVFVELLCLL